MLPLEQQVAQQACDSQRSIGTLWSGAEKWRPMKSPRQFTMSLISLSPYLVKPRAETASWSDLPDTSFVEVMAPKRTRKRRRMARASSTFKPFSRERRYGAPLPAVGIAGMISLLTLLPDPFESADVRESVPNSASGCEEALYGVPTGFRELGKPNPRMC